MAGLNVRDNRLKFYKRVLNSNNIVTNRTNLVLKQLNVKDNVLNLWAISHKQLENVLNIVTFELNQVGLRVNEDQNVLNIDMFELKSFTNGMDLELNITTNAQKEIKGLNLTLK